MLPTSAIEPSAWPQPDDVAIIVRQFGLAAETADSVAPRPLGGAVNHTLRVATDRGDVVVRVRRGWTTPARLAAEHHALGRLRAAGLRVADVFRTASGETWTRWHGCLVEVMTYLPHEGPADTWPRTAAAFAAMARFHAALAAPPLRLTPPRVSSYVTPRQALLMLRATAARFAAPQPGDLLLARAEAAELLRVLRRHWRTEVAALPRTVIHGDFGWANVLMRGDDVVGIVDLDFMARRERVFEPAYALSWALDRLGGWTPAGALSQAALMQAARCLDRYDASADRRLTAAERRALPWVMARVPLSWIAEAGYTPDAIGQTRQFAAHLPRARWLIEHAAAVAQVLAAR